MEFFPCAAPGGDPVVYCAKRTDLDAFAVYRWEVPAHLASMAGSHLVWRWTLWRWLFEKGWTHVYLEGFAAALLTSTTVALVMWGPCHRIYAADFERVGTQAMAWFIIMQHCLVMVLWFSVLLALFNFERSRTLEVQRAGRASAGQSAVVEDDGPGDEAELPSTPLKSGENFFVRDGDRYWFVPVETIRGIEADGNHARLWLDGSEPYVHRTLAQLEQRLPEDVFFRASRSQFVNLRCVESVEPSFSGSVCSAPSTTAFF